MADSFFKKLKRRNVFKVGAAYLVLAWVVIQISSEAVPALHLPDWVNSAVFFFGLIGFPFALFFAWAFEVTPDGIKLEKDEQTELDSQEELQSENKNIDYKKSIAILPFVNMSAEQEQEYFCDGLTEELLNVFASRQDLRVASRTSSFAYKNKNVSLTEIAEKLQVEHVLEGSVRKSGDSIRITAQLIEVATDSHLWSQTYNRQLDDIFVIQDDIANMIMDALKVKLTTTQPDHLTTKDSQAYEYFLRGVGYASSKGNKDQRLAIELFQKALEIDPLFVRAWIKIAESSALYAMFLSGGERCRKITSEAGAKAIELAPDYAESYMARGYAYLANKKYSEAEKKFFKAIDLDPSLAIAYHYLARSAFFQGNMEQALNYFLKSTKLDSEDFESPLLALQLFDSNHDEGEKLKIAKIGVERAKKQLLDYPNNQRAYYLGISGLFELGERDLANTWAERALQIAPDDTATNYNLACYYTNIGDYNKALDLLEHSISSRVWIENDPDLKPLYDLPRFQALLATLDN